MNTTFRRLLINTLVANVTTTFLSFAFAFWVYLVTRSVLAASVVTGVSMLIGSVAGTVFGAVVDAHRKKTAMALSSSITGVAFALAGVLYVVAGRELTNWHTVWFWAFTLLIVVGSTAGTLRSIALSTAVTLLVPEDRRDKANGLVGTVNGVAFLITSVLSGLAIGFVGMGGTIAIAMMFTGAVLIHLLFAIHIDEPRPEHHERVRIEVRTAWQTMRGVPGLLPLVLFSTFNNLIMGVFMALMDPYGLNLFSVQSWGFVLGFTSIGFIAGGALVARFGLGRSPLRLLLLANVAIAIVGLGTAVREWQALLVLGMFGFMLVIPVAEAAEQTILQRMVPFEKQGRVFGFAQSIETASTPIAAFAIGPAAQFLLIPYMNSSAGRTTFGWLLGDGQARGIALAFVVGSLLMLIVVLSAFLSAAYRRLNLSYAAAEPLPA
ncbi:MFS transporter [Kribbella sp. NPDC048915]|uniref:MFS transporter n=1 Tax=Kribbella sp. NPDC048915 TaxID=3155148 RepID=UPI0033EA8E9D